MLRGLAALGRNRVDRGAAMSSADGPESLIALARLLGRLAAQEYMKQQVKVPADRKWEEKQCK